MVTDDRRQREREDRRRLIAGTARALAEREGWDAVTTRRLSVEIEFSQPVIYKHFASMEELTEAVALEGFTELARAIDRARGRAGPAETLLPAARAYVRWAIRNPALYDAMFTRATRLRFADPATAKPLQAAFGALRAAVEPIAGDRDVDTLTEVVWAGLHGLTTLGRDQRLRPGHAGRRLELLVAGFVPHTEAC